MFSNTHIIKPYLKNQIIKRVVPPIKKLFFKGVRSVTTISNNPYSKIFFSSRFWKFLKSFYKMKYNSFYVCINKLQHYIKLGMVAAQACPVMSESGIKEGPNIQGHPQLVGTNLKNKKENKKGKGQIQWLPHEIPALIQKLEQENC